MPTRLERHRFRLGQLHRTRPDHLHATQRPPANNTSTTSQRIDYSEKISLLRKNQASPFLYQRERSRDLINRGGGHVVAQLYNATPDNDYDETTRVPIQINGIAYNIRPGGLARLVPGDALTISPRIYHKYWSEKSSCLLGEVSTVCDEENDYHFLEPGPRLYPQIEEDESPAHLLQYEYPEFE